MLRPGKIAKRREIRAVRELTREDLEVLKPPRPKVPAAQRFRDSHHRVARLFSSGMRATEVAMASGYSLNRVIQLEHDPAFQELIASYRVIEDDAHRAKRDEYYDLIYSNGLKAERVVADYLDDDEPIPLRNAITIARDSADRVGYSKHTLATNMNVDFGHLLERSIERSTKVIEAKPVQGAVTSHAHPKPKPSIASRPEQVSFKRKFA